jgi:hypothetical protein
VLLAAAFHRLWSGVGHGIDVTDEGLYLRSADAPGTGYAYVGLSGAYLHPVFRLAGYDVSGFRALGIILLSGAALVLSYGLARALAGGLEETPGTPGLGLLTRVCLHVAAVAGAVTYYSLFLLTPSYNWLTLVGVLLCGGGVLALLAPERGSRWDLVDPALVAMGSLLALMGRPTAGVGLWLLGAALVLAVSARRFRRRLVALGALAGFTVAFGVLHLLFVTGWSDSLTIARRTVYFSQHDVGAHSPGALIASSLDQLKVIGPGVTAMVGALPLIGLSVLLARLAPIRFRSRIAGLLGAASVGLVAWWVWTHHGFGGGRSAKLTLPFAGFALVLTAATVFVAATALRLLPGSGTARRDVLVRSGRFLATGVFFVLCAGLYTFSSNNGIVYQLWGGFGILAVAALLLLAGGVGRPALPVAAATMAVACGMAALSVFGQAAASPYRTAPVARSTVPIQVSGRGATVKASPEYAAALTSLRSQAVAGGWRPGTPLVDLTPFHPGVGYLLDARPPTTIMIGFSPSVMRWALRQQDLAVFHDAWLLIEPPAARGRLAVVDVLGRRFPADYQRVAAITYPLRHYRLELWRPRTQ